MTQIWSLLIRLQQEGYDQAEPQIGDRHIVQSDGQTSSEDPLEEDASVEQGWVRGRGVTYPQSQQRQCMSYQEIKAVIELPCGHLHCRDCIRLSTGPFSRRGAVMSQYQPVLFVIS